MEPIAALDSARSARSLKRRSMMSMLGKNRGIQRMMCKAAVISQRHRRQHYQGAHESAASEGTTRSGAPPASSTLNTAPPRLRSFASRRRKSVVLPFAIVARAAASSVPPQSALNVARRSFQEHTDSFEQSCQIHLGSGDHEALSAVLRSKKREEMSENGFVEVTSSFSP